MGQNANSASPPRRERPGRRGRPQSERDPVDVQEPPRSVETVLHRPPTLKEQWKAKRDANAHAREEHVKERQRKKEALRAALKVQEKAAAKDPTGEHGDGADVVDTDDETVKLKQAETEAMLTQAQINAQLAILQAKQFCCPTADDADEDGVMEDRGVTVAGSAARALVKCHDTHGDGRNNGGEDKRDVDTITDVSIHSSDYNDAELLQGLDDLDEELEREFQETIDTMLQQVAEHKQQSLIYFRDHQDKASALEELQKAKQLEARIQQLQKGHVTPLRVQLEEQEKKIVELENLVATRRQDAATALHAGDKPTAIALLKEAKGFDEQLKEAKTHMATLEDRKMKQLRGEEEV